MTKEQFDGYTYIEGGVCAAKGFLAWIELWYQP